MTDDNTFKQQTQSADQIDHADSLSKELEEELTDPINALQDRCSELEEKYKRAIADYRNLEHRMTQERNQYVKLANRGLVESLLEPLSFMETATKHIDDKGLQMVVERFYQALELEGLEEIKVKAGDIFDEHSMEAVDTAEGEEGKVVEVRQKGFTLNGVVIRHVQVVVGKKV